MRKTLLILSLLILLSGLYLFYEAVALENMAFDGDGVGTVLFFLFEKEMDNQAIPATALAWKQTSIWLSVISVLFFVFSRFVPESKAGKV